MSKSKGKPNPKRGSEREDNSFENERSKRRKESREKETKYRKKNFRDVGSDSDDEGGRRKPPIESNTPEKGSGRPGIGKAPHRSNRSDASEKSDFRSGKDFRSGDNFRSENSNSREFRRDEDSRGSKNPRSQRPERNKDKPFTTKTAPKQEPPVYQAFSYLQEGKEKVSPEERNIRLNKYIADAGVCSRREADKLIEAGLIKVNGEVVSELGYKVSRMDVVTHNGKKLQQEKFVYVLLNKPKDFITTVDDPEDRKTVMQLVENACNERIYPVGRLDRNTTGLLLLTNDGELAKKLTHPSHNIRKIYQVDLNKPLEEEDHEKIKEGVMLEDGIAKVDEIAILSEDRSIVGLEIHIGRNRIVRRIFEQLGYEVIRLDRVTFAGLTKKDLPRGKWRYLNEKELIRLKHFK